MKSRNYLGVNTIQVFDKDDCFTQCPCFTSNSLAMGHTVKGTHSCSSFTYSLRCPKILLPAQEEMQVHCGIPLAFLLNFISTDMSFIQLGGDTEQFSLECNL